MDCVSYEPIYVTLRKGTFGWSHWGELNPRPSPYQGDAIPLSHSGSAATTEGGGLIVATTKGRTSTNVSVKTNGSVRPSSRGRIARYCAGLESPWDFSRASSNLALGANIFPIDVNRITLGTSFLFNANGLTRTWCRRERAIRGLAKNAWWIG